IGSLSTPVRPASDAVTTIASPSPMTPARRRTPKRTPSTFTATTRRYSSSVSSAIDAVPVVTPALRQASSNRPTASHAAESVTSNPSFKSRPVTSAPSCSSRSTIARPIPPAAPVTSAEGGGHAGEAGMPSWRRRPADASGNKDDLADMAARLDELVGVGRALERERRTDERLHGAGRPELHKLADRLAHEAGVVTHQASEIEALQPEVAADERRGVKRLPPAAGESDRDDRPEGVQDAKALREDLAADRVENDVGSDLLGELVVAESLVLPLLQCDRPLLLRARGRHHAGTQMLRDLDSRRTDTARARMNQHDRSITDPNLPRKRNPRSQVRQQEPGALFERRTLRQRHDQALVHGDRLRVAAASGERHHAASVCLASDLRAGDRRQLRGLRVAPLPHEHVGEIDPGCANAHDELTGSRLGVGHLLEPEPVRRAGLAENDCFHGRPTKTPAPATWRTSAPGAPSARLRSRSRPP